MVHKIPGNYMRVTVDIHKSDIKALADHLVTRRLFSELLQQRFEDRLTERWPDIDQATERCKRGIAEFEHDKD